MKITIQKAKNGEDTAVAEGHFLHSNYAPVKEAERFVNNLTLPFTPSCIVITEPALAYSAVLLKQKFPEIKIGAIRYCEDFNSYNNHFDFVLNYYQHTSNFETYLENYFTEDNLLTTHFISWQASSQVFKDIDTPVWNAIKSAMVRAKTLLITRQYFEKKWFLNSCNYITHIANTISIENPINKPALIISSGPSILPFINLIKENQNKFFIICLSSAISVCLNNSIIPDLCMTTDGGFWAGEHLKPLNKTSIPLAIPAEAYCPKQLLSKLDVLPLDYGDGISSDLINSIRLHTKKAVRNGTVSGTALLFALSWCTKNIYLTGLDMASQTGYQHAQPNQLEFNSSLSDNRIRTKCTRLTKSELTNGSLDIYKNWFINTKLDTGNRKVYRLIQNKDKKNSLGWIQDIETEEFEKQISCEKETAKIQFEKQKFNFDSAACNIFSDNSRIEKWQRQLFPLDFIQSAHNPENTEIKSKIENKWDELKTKAESILNGNL